MHELSLAQSMVSELVSYIEKNNVKKVHQVTIVIGKLSGAEKEPFEFAFPIAAEGTLLETAELVVEIQKVVILCNECRSETTLDMPLMKCPSCSSRSVKIIKGKEFIIKSMEIE
ncbi:MAG: hydrogenase maturation nickel metallochaperone HypA [Lentisphaerae bacterium GWF2_38_69]|nr:MAG: hydrogenase maturation nickel metallochaperone HypA [Lentisphaerae bacterium GWF2_38_69]